MPYLQRIMQNSVVCENAYTYISQTKPTLRAMFLGKKDIDDYAYKISTISHENSPVIRFLEKYGYDIKVISAYMNDTFPYEYLTDQFSIDVFEPASIRLWDLLSSRFSKEKKTLYLVHLFDAHYPYLSVKLNDKNYEISSERYKLAKVKLDEQLDFYDSFVNEDGFRIYMSDHGYGTVNRFHVLFNIYQKNLMPRRISDFVSLLDFGSVLKQIVLYSDIKQQEFSREYVEIGGMDLYSHSNVQDVFLNRSQLSLLYFGFKGIIDKEHIYIHYKTGKELLWKRSENTRLFSPLTLCDCDGDICDVTLLPQYRKLAGEYPKDIENDEKFKYSKYLWLLYRNIMKHNNIPMRVHIINQLFDKYSSKSIAIRMGGMHSLVLYYILTKENKEKIWGFIDNNSECICSKLQLPIVNTDQIRELKQNGVEGILLSSYDNIELLRDESLSWPADLDVLDIYISLDKSEIQCTENFYNIQPVEEDYDVGFPFDGD